MTRAVVVGAGLAGLTAAVNLADAGLDVTVLERRRQPGGRVGRLFPGEGRAPVDCGQHLMLGCYGETIGLLRRLGSDKRLERVGGPAVFVSGAARVHRFETGDFPPPFHLLPAITGLSQLSVRDRLGLGVVLAAARLQAASTSSTLDGMSARRWLKQCRQGDGAIAGFWEPLVLATLNVPVNEASALLLATVLDRGILAGKEASTPMLPRSTLHDLLVAPAVAALEARGGRVVTGQRIVRLLDDGAGRLAAAVNGRGDRWDADLFVLAVPSWDLASMSSGKDALSTLAADAALLGSSGIITVNLWFDRPWMPHRMAGLLGGTMQWVFDHPEDPPDAHGHRITLVQSSAGVDMAEPNAVLVDRAVGECHRFFGDLRGAVVRSGLVLKARRSTFRGVVGQGRLRAACTSPYPNALLAGDWTATGLPATIEGAIASGAAAATGLLSAANRGRACSMGSTPMLAFAGHMG